MNAREFLTQYGPDEAEKVAKLAGTNLAYFKQLAYGHRRASVNLAQKLVNADPRLDFVALLQSKKSPPAQGVAA